MRDPISRLTNASTILPFSLEKDTDRTPDATQFHHFQHDTLIASFLTTRSAEQAYHQAIAESGYQHPVVDEPEDDGQSAAEREQRGRR